MGEVQILKNALLNQLKQLDSIDVNTEGGTEQLESVVKKSEAICNVSKELNATFKLQLDAFKLGGMGKDGGFIQRTMLGNSDE